MLIHQENREEEQRKVRSVSTREKKWREESQGRTVVFVYFGAQVCPGGAFSLQKVGAGRFPFLFFFFVFWSGSVRLLVVKSGSDFSY